MTTPSLVIFFTQTPKQSKVHKVEEWAHIWTIAIEERKKNMPTHTLILITHRSCTSGHSATILTSCLGALVRDVQECISNGE